MTIDEAIHTTQPHDAPHLLSLMVNELIDTLSLRHTGDAPAVGRATVHTVTIDIEEKKIDIVPADSCTVTEADDIKAYGKILEAVLNAAPAASKRLLRIARLCENGEIDSFAQLRLLVERRISNTIYIPLIIIIAVLIGLLAWLNNS